MNFQATLGDNVTAGSEGGSQLKRKGYLDLACNKMNWFMKIHTHKSLKLMAHWCIAVNASIALRTALFAAGASTIPTLPIVVAIAAFDTGNRKRLVQAAVVTLPLSSLDAGLCRTRESAAQRIDCLPLLRCNVCIATRWQGCGNRTACTPKAAGETSAQPGRPSIER